MTVPSLVVRSWSSGTLDGSNSGNSSSANDFECVCLDRLLYMWSEDNPADCASHSLKPPELRYHDL
ncbi:hypothetical protein FWK35_00011444 [Aphis craccivora]|uniref:Uncharacterized protein n=1 Tax=Aphis craccivora TaxID=307492 RepID=A0A6G0Z983_APHCR|nr:hypothetical protein FWK35_00011444 [Aphis craccivora]